MARRAIEFQTIRSEGGLLPPDLLRRVIDPKAKLPGTKPEDYGLVAGDRLNETITQSWNQLRRHWREFQAAAVNLAEGEAGTGLTNDRWNLPLLRELGFGLLPTSPGPELNGRTYAINRYFGPVPVHLLGCGLSLDRRTAGQRGAAAINPHGLVQEFLNRSTDHLWAVVANGLRFRILRDNQALSRQSFLEFDLEAMFNGEVFSDFVLFWLMAHASRFAPRNENQVDSCWLEQWTREAAEQGTRALGDLRQGVEKALQMLGEGFTSHPKNTQLREALRDGTVTLINFHGQLMRVVYRLIFLFVAEDRTLEGRPLLHPRDTSEAARLARERYASYYSTSRLRDMAAKIMGSRHGDLWQQFQLLVTVLSGGEDSSAARQQLALPALGSFLWDPAATGILNEAALTNHDFLETLRHLAFTRQGRVLRPVDYKHLGAEELGGVYESLLALTPQISADGLRFSFAEFAGNERKTSGSYYTPDSLVQCLLDSALDPVVNEAIKGKNGEEAEKAILGLRVCDPAVGSGHFLVGAAHRLAQHLARVRALAQGESEPSPLFYQHALRDVIGRCLYGVDVNPMSAELCRVNLWLEALEPGKPLSFLDHHIRVGNSLLGTTPELIAAGLPDEAFKAIAGDDKKACAELKKRNKAGLKGRGNLFADQYAKIQARLAQAAAALEELPDDRPEAIRAKELAFRRHEETEAYREKKLLADTWCAAFVIKKYFPPHPTDPRFPSSEPYGITQGLLNGLASGNPLSAGMAEEVEQLARQYQFFHWHLTFPEVFANGGFDCMLGNPPWERVKLQEKEWFATKSEAVMNAPNAAARKKVIAKIKTEHPVIYSEFLAAAREAESESHLIRNGGRFRLCAQGDLNTYSLFAELFTQMIRIAGFGGIIVPTGIATDDSNSSFFGHLIQEKRLVSLFDFENRERVLFPEVYYRMRFCVLTICGSTRSWEKPTFTFFALKVEDLAAPGQVFSLSKDDISLINPNSKTCPVFHSYRDAEIVRQIYRKVPILISEVIDTNSNPWGIQFSRTFHMTNDAGLFVSGDFFDVPWNQGGNRFAQGGEGYLPLYEGRMIDNYDHRLASTRLKDIKLQRSGESVTLTSEQKVDPTCVARPRYWVSAANVESASPKMLRQGWVLGCMSITSATNARTCVMSVVPQAGMGNSVIGLFSKADARHQCCLLANFCALPFDYVCKQKVSGNNFNMFIIKQLPVLPPAAFDEVSPWDLQITLLEWIVPRVMELAYTAHDLRKFAWDSGYEGEPFRWNDDRRFLLRCELDAAFLHLFGMDRDAACRAIDTFTIVQSREEEGCGDYRTKRVILEIYDAMQQAIRTGQPYQTRLDPPPGPPADTQGNFIQPADWTPEIYAKYNGIIHPPKEKTR